MCAAYEAHTVHRRGPQEYQRTLFDFWDPFVSRLRKVSGSFFEKHIKSQQCFDRLSGHSIMNYYSHWQADPYSWGAMGDVTYVWEEFQAFQKLFVCEACGRPLRYDRNDQSLHCKCGGKAF